ncbi:endo-1,4-beta-xylanase 5-like [Pyrus communis]|uniref:endo-1,4-beta-xylanase 5-like n=1 Tax=Pyrus communis TaxID=23211 RepID=UPI0035C2477A
MTIIVVLRIVLLNHGFEVNCLSYDYTASIECLAKPHKPQYRGGIIVNSELNDGLKGWSAFGNAKIQHRHSEGNKFIVAYGRNQPHDSISQKIYLHRNKLYTFSAWIQVSSGIAPVTAIFKTSSVFVHAGAIVAESGCWSMLKGGLTVNATGPAELYFESKNASVGIFVDSISLQPFTEKQWYSHQQQSIEKIRKTNVRVRAVDEQANPLENATITIQQRAAGFPFGVAINKNILTNTAYQNWFTSRPFTVTTFEDEMKWYSTEPSWGREDYSASDALLQFAKQHKIAVRGHNVFWDDPHYQPSWLNSLSGRQFSDATYKRLNSVMGRYKGQVIAWDVCNENLHFNFFESKMGANASAEFYNWASKADGTTTLFLNDYNTIEESGDQDSTPAKYLQKLRDIQGFPGNENVKMAIGLESHFNTPNIPYIRSSIDTLAAAKVPIWITELDVSSSPNQASYLEQILREVHAHPQIQGIVIWSAWKPWGCYRMCLTDNNFKNLPTGDVVDKLSHEFGLTSDEIFGTTDANGFFEASLFQGDYEVKITHPFVNPTLVWGLNVAPSIESQQQMQLQVNVSSFVH